MVYFTAEKQKEVSDIKQAIRQELEVEMQAELARSRKALEAEVTPAVKEQARQARLELLAGLANQF